MRLRFRVAKVEQVETKVVHRERAAETVTIENVLLEAVSGPPWAGSAAGSIRMTIDQPAAQGQLREGAELDVVLELGT